MTCNRHIWHANLFTSTRNDPFNTNRLTRITNKYSFYFRFLKYLLYSAYILNLKENRVTTKTYKWYSCKLKLSLVMINLLFAQTLSILILNIWQVLWMLYFCWILLFWIWVKVYALLLECKELISRLMLYFCWSMLFWMWIEDFKCMLYFQDVKNLFLYGCYILY